MSQNLTLLSHNDHLSFFLLQNANAPDWKGESWGREGGGGEGWAYLGESILVYFGGNNELLITFFFKSASREI